VELVLEKTIEVFTKWGCPKALRVDNGEPFGSPEPSTTPALALWMIGHQVKMTWNKPGCPQQNGVVERMQRTSAAWAEIKKCTSIEQVQKRLDQAALIQREQYPVSRLQGKTRFEAFPQVKQIFRPCNNQQFKPQLVYDFLGQKVFTRKSSNAGQITHMGHRINLGAKNKKLAVSLKLNPKTVVWEIFNPNGLCIKQEPADYLKPKRILNLSVFSKN